MSIGRMDQQVTLQRAAETADGAGGVTVAWSNLATDPTVWAMVRPKSGREEIDLGRMNASQVAVFTIWNRSDLTERDRLLWNGEAWNIRSLVRLGGRELRLAVEAERGVAS